MTARRVDISHNLWKSLLTRASGIGPLRRSPHYLHAELLDVCAYGLELECIILDCILNGKYVFQNSFVAQVFSANGYGIWVERT